MRMSCDRLMYVTDVYREYNRRKVAYSEVIGRHLFLALSALVQSKRTMMNHDRRQTGGVFAEDPTQKTEQTKYRKEVLYDNNIPQLSQPPKDRLVPPKPEEHKFMSRQETYKTFCSNRRLMFLGFVVAVVVVAALVGIIVYLSGENIHRNDKPIVNKTETLFGTLVADKKDYNSTTYGNPNSTEYKNTEKDFCYKIMVPLSRNGFEKNMKTCSVTGYSKGSLLIRFKLVMSTSGQSIKAAVRQQVEQEFMKIGGLFKDYLKHPSTAKMTWYSSPEQTTSEPSQTTRSTSAMRAHSTVRLTTQQPINSMPVDEVTDVSTPQATSYPGNSSTSETTPRSTLQKPYCMEHDNPCQYGGTCLSKGPDSYLCLCLHCGCTYDKPNRNCTVDTKKVCVGKYERDENTIAHPYLCTMYIKCTGNVATHEGYVFRHEDGKHVFNPDTRLSDFAWEVKCAKTTRPQHCGQMECQNNAVCEDIDLTGFKCHCPAGYTGDLCETRLKTCAELQCGHGTCERDDDPGAHCVCDSTHCGDRCEESIVSCAEVACQNGGICHNTSCGFKCHCIKDYTGRNCEMKISDHCTPDPCHSNFTRCVNLKDGHKCVCKSCSCTIGYAKDDCTLNPSSMCQEQKLNHPKKDWFYLPHPYNCDWYIWCFNKGFQGVNMKCAPPALFNPNYKNTTDNCITDTKPCTQE